MLSTTTRRAAGNRGAQCRSAISRTRHATPRVTVAALAWSRCATMSPVARITFLWSLETPTSLDSCPTMMTTATPVMYPTRTAWEK